MFEATFTTFVIYFIIGAVSRLPKTQLSDGAVVVDLSDMFILITTVQFGLLGGFGMLLLQNGFVMTHLRMEGPLELGLRIFSFAMAIILLKIVLVFSGMSVVAAVILVATIGCSLRAVLSFVFTGWNNPAFFATALFQILIYRWILGTGYFL